jgi:hypothetical protein
VIRRRALIGARSERAHVDEPPHAGRPRCIEHASGAVDMHGGEGGGTPLDNDADQVYRCIGAVEQQGERSTIAEGAGYELDSLGLEETRTGEVPHQGTDAVTATQEQRGKMPAHKPGGTGDGD